MVPSVLPEAFGMVAAEAASCGVMPVVADHSGLAEVAAGLGPASRTFDGSVDDLERAVGEVLAMPAADGRRSAWSAASGSAPAGAGSGSPIA